MVTVKQFLPFGSCKRVISRSRRKYTNYSKKYYIRVWFSRAVWYLQLTLTKSELAQIKSDLATGIADLSVTLHRIVLKFFRTARLSHRLPIFPLNFNCNKVAL